MYLLEHHFESNRYSVSIKSKSFHFARTLGAELGSGPLICILSRLYTRDVAQPERINATIAIAMLRFPISCQPVALQASHKSPPNTLRYWLNAVIHIGTLEDKPRHLSS